MYHDDADGVQHFDTDYSNVHDLEVSMYISMDEIHLHYACLKEGYTLPLCWKV